MPSSPPFYLDYNATTPLHPEAKRAMLPYLEGTYGNASSMHGFGRSARAAIDKSRQTLAEFVGAKEKEIIFTSGGTESNNLAILGIARAHRERGTHIITCATEHHAVLHPCEHLKKEGFEVEILPVDSLGRLSLAQLEKALRPETILVTIMSSNNETGTLHPVKDIGTMCRKKKVIFHTDAIQSFGKEPINVDEWNVDLLSTGGHKIYGPKGVGALYIRTGTKISAIQLGGFHENERRAGTENVAAIVGMAEAAKQVISGMKEESERLFQLTEGLWKELSSQISGIKRNGDPIQRLGNTLNVSFENCDGEGLIMGLDLEGIAVSSGSACMVGSILPSHVLRAMGVKDELAKAAVRFSLGIHSSEKDIPEIVRRVKTVVQRLQSKSAE